MIQVNNISKSFRGEQVLNRVNVTFDNGKISGVVGKNGSGKTVLFKIICGYIYPDEGTVEIINSSDKKVVIGKDIDFPESIGVIIETPGFLPHRSAEKNLNYLASLKGHIGRKEVRSAIERVGLNPDNKKGVGKYSLGMRQRLGIAQAIMEDPEILVLDEPMNGLDQKGIEEIRDLLCELRTQGKTILIASHNKEDIDILCDTVYAIEQGSISKVR